jgi:ATP-dependent DNA helicase RecQ
MESLTPQTPVEVLQKYWGFSAFRPMQEEIIQAAIAGQDALALLPTGGGKSLCYQVPALIRPGVCLVISPLVALMKDQVLNLQKRGVPAAALYSGMPAAQMRKILDDAAFGRFKLLYISPERLATPAFKDVLQHLKVGLLAVDEAHCISQWGYDFRPPYLEIGALRAWMPGVPILALTATATERVVEDIQERLLFKNQAVFKQGFSRPNLAYVVLNETDKFGKIVDVLTKVPGSSIVYARNRRRTQEFAARLAAAGISANFYHAGMTHQERDQVQNDWINDKLRVVVCTNAFGMGIDKPGVRTVLHADVPESPEAYFQEAGRAGRDGKKAFAILLYDTSDKAILQENWERSYPNMDLLRAVYQALASYTQIAVGPAPTESFDFDIATWLVMFKLNSFTAHAALRLLELEGWITITESGVTQNMIQILVEKEKLYEYQIKNKQIDKLINGLMRNFHDLQADLRPVDNAKLARSLAWGQDMLEKALVYLHKEGLITYQKASKFQQLTFLQERVDAKNLTIDLQRFQFRKERSLHQWQSMANYAELPNCRSLQLLTYFNDLDDRLCGICDVCLGRKKEVTPERIIQLEQDLIALLKLAPLGLEAILAAFLAKEKNAILNIIQNLAEENLLIRNPEGLWSLLS